MTARRPNRVATVAAVAATLVGTACTSSDGPGTPPTTTAGSVASAPGSDAITVPTPLWAAVLTGPSNEDEVDGVAAGPDGSLWVTGKFERTATLGGTELTSAGMADIPLARFDASGEPGWVQRFGGPGEDNLFDIDADEWGAVGTGIISGTVELGATTLTSSGPTDCVVVAVDLDGAVRWATTFGGPGLDGCNEVVIAPDGSVVTSMDTEGGWGPDGSDDASAGRDTVLLHLSPDGDLDWARTVGGPGRQRGKALAVADDGSIAFGGDTVGPVTVDATTTDAPGTKADAFLTRWSGEGQLDWVTTWGGPANDLAKGVAFSRDAAIVVGTVTGSVAFDDGAIDGGIDAGPDTDLLVARFDADGTVAWHTTVEADVSLAGAEIAAHGDGVVFGGAPTTGLVLGQADGSSAHLDEDPGGSTWIVSYADDGTVRWASTIAGTVDAQIDEVAIVGDRAYLDVVIRGDENVLPGTDESVVAARKDGSVWAIDLPT
ncbi:MAG: hypothetical protein KF906_06865 [Actinobacteria bacterium]|nr:hypothetical protein [Actinomycetota bacterium]